MTSKLKNYYNLIPDKYKPKTITYPNYDKVNINIPFRMLICGTSGSHKTNTLFNLIDQINGFTRFFLFAKDLQEPLYACFIETMTELGSKLKRTLLTASSDIKKIPSVDKFDTKETNLVIIDDMVTEKDLSYVHELFTRGRKKNISVIFITQSYFETPKIIRGCCNYIILKKVTEIGDVGRIVRENGSGEDPHTVEKLYSYCINLSNLNFFMIDKDTDKDSLRFRCNFDGFVKN